MKVGGAGEENKHEASEYKVKNKKTKTKIQIPREKEKGGEQVRLQTLMKSK